MDTLYIDLTVTYVSSAKSKRGGGICKYILNQFAEYVAVMNKLSYVNEDIEQLWIQLTVPNVTNASESDTNNMKSTWPA